MSGNRLLAALPAKEYGRLAPRLEAVDLPEAAVLVEPGQVVADVYFPTTAVLSLLTVLERGRTVEVGLVGREGMAGLPVLLGAPLAAARTVVQVPGQALRMSARDFRREVTPEGPLHGLLLRYVHAYVAKLSRAVACGTLHPVGQRLARWLLMCHDRAGADQFPLTHIFMAAMLAVRRASVTEAARGLQRAGLISYVRGKVTILDRDGLEASCCGCYRAIRDEEDRVLA